MARKLLSGACFVVWLSRSSRYSQPAARQMDRNNAVKAAERVPGPAATGPRGIRAAAALAAAAPAAAALVTAVVLPRAAVRREQRPTAAVRR